MKGYTPIILLIVLGAFFYIAVLRPQRRRQAQAAEMRNTLLPGVEVMTTAGLYGTVVDVADDVVTLEVSPGVTHRYVRAAIAKVVPPSATAEAGYGELDEAAHDDSAYDDSAYDDSGYGATAYEQGQPDDELHDGPDEPPAGGRPHR